MCSKLFLLALVVLVVALVEANQKTKKLDSEVDIVVKKLEEKITAAAMETDGPNKDGLTKDGLEATGKATLTEMKSHMKAIEKLEPDSSKVAKKITDKLAVKMEKVMKGAGMKKGEVDANIAVLKTVILQEVKDFQKTN